jgi:hypothetical protein
MLRNCARRRGGHGTAPIPQLAHLAAKNCDMRRIVRLGRCSSTQASSVFRCRTGRGGQRRLDVCLWPERSVLNRLSVLRGPARATATLSCGWRTAEVGGRAGQRRHDAWVTREPPAWPPAGWCNSLASRGEVELHPAQPDGCLSRPAAANQSGL